VQIIFDEFRSATTPDGRFEKFADPGDNSSSYVRVKPEYAGRPANTRSGMYSIYLPYPGDAPEHIVAEARAFSTAVYEAVEARKAAKLQAERDECTARIAAEDMRRKQLQEQAAATGSKVLVRRYVAGCDGSAYECSQDFIVEYIDGEGRITRRRSHAH